jgi:UDP-GlcNAc:undecaprenyl-phosphate GlcNAc-1-phosphate transferase
MDLVNSSGLVSVGIASFLVAMGATWIVTPGVIWLARKLGAVDLPGGRRPHSGEVPRIGGLAVFIGFVAGAGFAAAATGSLFNVPEVGIYWRGLAFAASGMLLVGVLDDLYGLSYRWKFAAQIVAAVYMWNCGFTIDAVSNLALGGTLHLQWLSLPITVLWIVGITNAVNLIDGLDGLAAGIALITTITLATIALAREQQSMGVAAISIVLAGSLIGFLRFNFNPARIFLGDSGSMFLGFVLAVISVRGSQKGATAVAVFVPLLVLGLPLLDTGLAVLRRLYRLGNHGGRTQNRLTYMLRNLNYVFLPDRGHIHHRLLDLGLGQRGAVMVLYGAALLLALAGYALTFKKNGIELALLLGGVLVVSMATFLALLYFRVWRVKNGGRSEITEERDPPVPKDPLPSPVGRSPSR